jgi:hypothetical protein
VEDVRQSVLGVTWMDGVVVVRENQEMTNFKSHVIELVVESVITTAKRLTSDMRILLISDGQTACH